VLAGSLNFEPVDSRPMATLHPRLPTAESLRPLEGRVLESAVLALLPVVLTSAAFAAHAVLVGPGREYTAVDASLVYGAALAVVGAGLYVRLSGAARRAVFAFDRPGGRELAATLGAFVVGVLLFPVVTAAAEAVSLPPMGGFDYALSDPVTVAIVVVGSVVLAPLIEEVLFRGYLLGALLARGLHPAVAGAVVVLFGAMHIVSLGPTGVLFTAVWGVLPTALRLYFDDLTSAWLLHLLNNAYAYVLVVALF
jgi:membrane protease YdiL (CAAX protease family)